jgi:acylphosphatase
MIAYRIKVTGRVQGVFFRASTKEKADQIGIEGWVRNERDGSVLIEAEGEEEQMKQFVEWCRRGSSASQVDDVGVEEIDISGFTSFVIAD